MKVAKSSVDQKKLISSIDKQNDKAWKISRVNPDDAIKLAEKSLKDSKSIRYAFGKAKALHIIGASYTWLSNSQNAEKYVSEAISLLEEHNQRKELGAAFYSMGLIYLYKGDFANAKEYFIKCHQTFVDVKDKHGEVMSLNGLGTIYTEVGELDRAWEYLADGIKLSDEIKEDLIKTRLLDGMANVCIKKGEFKKAIEILNQAYEFNRKKDRKHSEAYNLEGIGESYMNLDQPKAAKEFFAKSIEIWNKTGFKIGVAISMAKLGRAELMLGEIQQAEQDLSQAMKLAESINAKSALQIALKGLAELYEIQQDWKKSNEYIKRERTVTEELSDEKSVKNQNYQLEQAFQNTKILSEIGQEIISNLELEKVLFTIYEKVNLLMDASVFGIGLYVEKEQVIEYKLAIDRGKRYKPYTRNMSDKSQLAVWCIENKQSIFINDVESDTGKYNKAFSSEREKKRHKEYQTKASNIEQSYIYVPIMSGDNVIGVITVQSYEKKAYTSHHLDILKNIAIYASIAVINSRMYEALEEKVSLSEKIEEQNKQLERSFETTRILNEIGHNITMSLSINEVIAKVYESINDLLDATNFGIGIYNSANDKLEFEGAIEKGKKLPSFSYALNEDSRPAVYCFKKKKEVVINNWKKDIGKYIKKRLPPATGKRIESLIYFPLVLRGKTLGVISVQSFQQHAYNSHHLDILKNLAIPVATAIENALLYKNLEGQVEERTREVTTQRDKLEEAYNNTKTLSDITQTISSSLSQAEIIQKVYDSVNSMMDAAVFGIGIYDAHTKELNFEGLIEEGKVLQSVRLDVNDENRPAAISFNKKIEIISSNWLKDYKKYTKKALPPAAGKSPISLIYVPLITKGRAIGVLTVQSFQTDAYSNYHLDMVRNLAIPVSSALENARLYESLEDQVLERTKEVTVKHDELEVSYRNTQALNGIVRDISASLSMKDVIKKVYKNINSLMDAAVFLIALYNEEKDMLVIEGGMEKGKQLPYIEFDLKDEERLAVMCFKQQKEIIMNDFVIDVKKYLKNPPTPVQGGLMHSVVYFPLISKSKVLGVFTVQSFKKNAYTSYHVDLLRNLSVYAPIALENAMMYGKMEREVKERTQEVVKQRDQLEQAYHNTKILSEIGREINSSLSIQEIIQKVYDSINAIMDAENFGVGIYNEAENRLEFEGAIESGTKLDRFGYSLEDENRPGVYCFNHKSEVVINEYERDFKKYFNIALPPVTGGDTQSLIYFPLISKDKVLGVISVQSLKMNAYTSYHLDIIKSLATPVATAIENALLYESLEDKVKERTDELVKEKEKAEFEREEAKYQRRRAEQSERFKQQFLANMSHEIRTPMNAIMGMTNLVLEKEPKKEHISYLNTIKQSSENLLVIINDILDLSKIEAGKMELEQVDFDLKQVVSLIEKTLMHRAEEKGLVLSVSYDDQIPDVLLGDAVRLQQVLMNITGNAIKFTEKGGVSLSVNLEGGMLMGDHAKVRFEIRDTGIGMTRDQQNRVFENFSQATSDTTRKYGGTGLGLSISSKLIELFNSSIKLESEIGHGSTFHFVINFRVSTNKAAVTKEKGLSESMLKELNGVRILLAEDNEYNRVVATETLELKIKDVKVIVAVNGEEAVKKAEENADGIDIVLMDVQMPIMDGFDATRNIRKSLNDKTKNLPIVALTASVIRADIQRCFDAGMNGYIPKPFKTSELIQAIYDAVTKGGVQENISLYIKQDNESNGMSHEKLIHLSYLHDFTEGDKVRMDKYINMYLEACSENINKLNLLLNNKDYDGLKRQVHSMKPHFDFMGMRETRELSEMIENQLLHKKDIDSIPEKIEKLISDIKLSVNELNEERA